MENYNCSIHGLLLPKDCHVSLNKRGYTQLKCKVCACEYRKKYYLLNKDKVSKKNKEWRANNKERVKANDARVRQERPHLYQARYERYYKNHRQLILDRGKSRYFGIELSDYHKMVEEQQNKCAICLKEETKVYKGVVTALSIDHCHVTKKVRRLLCHQCNIGVGSFKDDITLLQSAIDYLKKHAT